MSRSIRRFALVVIAPMAPLTPLALSVARELPAQAAPSTSHAPGSDATTALASWLAIHAPPGDEHHATALIARTNQRWQRDDLGNLVLRAGSGRPRRVVACALDHPSLVISQITAAGYLRLHRAGRSPHPLWEQFHEGQQILVLTDGGPVPGVVAIPNGHFSRQHRGDTAVVTADDLWVDVGVTTHDEAHALGIRLLDPIVRDVPPWPYAGHIAGPNASGRIGCAAVGAAAAAPAPSTGETIYVMAIQWTFSRSGMNAALSRLGPIDQLAVVAPGLGREALGAAVARPSFLAADNIPASVAMLGAPVLHEGTLVESVRLDDAEALRAAVARAAGLDASASYGWVILPAPAAQRARRADALTPVAELLDTLVELPGVPEHEHRVRDAVRAALPAWARERATVDSIGNLVVSAGPDRDTVLVVAHLDEVGYTITGIARDGTVSLRTRGGVIPSAWEGQPALLHFDPPSDASAARPSLPGIFLPRDDRPSTRRPDAVGAWFGMDSAALAAAGVRPGLGVTAYKRGLRLGATRFTARALDDRAGTTALILALRRIDPARLPHKVIFAWSVAEEGGLVGARAMADRFGPTLRRVHAVDTFVSSDTPLESPHFAYAPLGAGPVMRGLDDGMISPRAERGRILAIARDAGIPIQVGTTHGSTDGTVFVRWGAPNVGLSWPGRYSHSPAELLDLRDLDALAKLVAAVATAPAR